MRFLTCALLVLAGGSGSCTSERPTAITSPTPPSVACSPPCQSPSTPRVARAIWVWSMSDTIVMNDTSRLDFYSFLAAPHGNPNAAIQAIFLSLSPAILKNHPTRVHEFLRDAHSRGMRVDFLTGDPLWALTMNDPTGSPYNLESIQVLQQVLAFNAQTHDPQQRFDGFQQDTEPYLLHRPLSWHNPKDRNTIWTQYIESLTHWQKLVDTHNQTVGDNIVLGAAIPFWWDPGQVPPANHTVVQDIVDYIAIMNYDTRSPVEMAASEIRYADTLPGRKNSVYVGLETLEVFWREPTQGFFHYLYPHSSSYYYLGNDALEKDANTIAQTYRKNPSFLGIAYHYYEPLAHADRRGETSYRALANKQTNHAPAVLLRGLSPNMKISGLFDLRYEAVDPDGDALGIQISSSSNNGKTWNRLPAMDARGNAMHIDDGLYTIRAASLQPNIDYLFQVQATELTPTGLTSADISDGFVRLSPSPPAPPPLLPPLQVSTHPAFPAPGNEVTVHWQFATNLPAQASPVGFYYSHTKSLNFREAKYTTAFSARIIANQPGPQNISIWTVDQSGKLSSVPTSKTYQVYPDLDGDSIPDVKDYDIDGDGIRNKKEHAAEQARDPKQLPKNLTIGLWDFENALFSNRIPNGPGLVVTHGKPTTVRVKRNETSTTALSLPAAPNDPVHLALSAKKAAIGTTHALTVEMWIKPIQATQIDYIPLFFKGDLEQGLALFLKNDRNEVAARCYYKTQEASPLGKYTGITAPLAPILDGQWHHIALSYNGLDQTIKLYVDKKLAAQHKGTTVPPILNHPRDGVLFDARSSHDNDNRYKKHIPNSALFANNRYNRDWQHNTRFAGLVDNIKITKAALGPALLDTPTHLPPSTK